MDFLGSPQHTRMTSRLLAASRPRFIAKSCSDAKKQDDPASQSACAFAALSCKEAALRLIQMEPGEEVAALQAMSTGRSRAVLKAIYKLSPARHEKVVKAMELQKLLSRQDRDEAASREPLTQAIGSEVSVTAAHGSPPARPKSLVGNPSAGPARLTRPATPGEAVVEKEAARPTIPARRRPLRQRARSDGRGRHTAG